MKRALGLFLIAVGCCLVVWRLTCPALVRVRSGPMAGNTLLLVPNPLRSGPAKKSAEELLVFLRSKDREGASKRFPLLERRNLEDNMIDPPTRWSLDDIVANTNGGLDFEFLNETASHPMGGYIWIHCTRDKLGSWTVSQFDRVY